MADERTKAIDLAFAQIEKQFGKGSIMRLGSKEAIVPISVIPTGAISFDAALGVGGFPFDETSRATARCEAEESYCFVLGALQVLEAAHNGLVALELVALSGRRA